MYDMDMRDYDPAIGRWVSQDPVVHFDYSPYSAFDNNPVFWSDPSGADSMQLQDFNGIWHTINSNQYTNIYSASDNDSNDNDDWVYNTSSQTYQWNENATSKGTTPKGFEYVGKTKSDIDRHYKKKHNFKSFFRIRPNIDFESKYSYDIKSIAMQVINAYKNRKYIPLTPQQIADNINRAPDDRVEPRMSSFSININQTYPTFNRDITLNLNGTLVTGSLGYSHTVESVNFISSITEGKYVPQSIMSGHNNYSLLFGNSQKNNVFIIQFNSSEYQKIINYLQQ